MRKITITMDWKKKNTDAVPMAAIARISRGNDTFFTSPELVTTAPVALSTPTWKRLYTRRPENKKMTKCGMPLREMYWNTTKKMASVMAGETSDQTSPRNEFLYLTLISVRTR